MEKITIYLNEKLRLGKDTYVIDPLNANGVKYKGVELTYANKDSVTEFINYSNVDLEVAYELLYKVIDKFEKELQNYTIKLFYSGYAGFIFINNENKSCMGHLIFNKNFRKELQTETGIGCYFMRGNGNYYDKNLTEKIIDWVGTVNRTFKY